MSRALVQFNDYVSLAVMLLMLAALLGGRSSAADSHTQERYSLAASMPFSIVLDGRLGHQAAKAGIAAVATMRGSSHFRGEDE